MEAREQKEKEEEGGLSESVESPLVSDPSWLPRFPYAPVFLGLFVLALLWSIYFARDFLIPVVTAFYLKLVLTPVVRRLWKWGVPWSVGAAIVVGLSFLAVAGAVYNLSGPASDWLERAPGTLRQVEYRLRSLKAPVEQVSEAAKQVEELADVDGETNAPAVEVRDVNLASYFFRSTGSFVAMAVSTAVLLYLLLASGDLFLRKAITVLPRLEDKVRAVDLSTELESHISRYLFTIVLINATLGIVVGFALYFLGMPNPALWGVMVALFNFIPYVGALASFVILTFAGFVAFDDLGRGFLVGSVFFGLNALEAYVVTPTVLGRRMSMNPVAIFLSVVFFGWSWGVVGALLAVPMLVTFKLCCDHIQPLEPVGEFLGG